VLNSRTIQKQAYKFDDFLLNNQKFGTIKRNRLIIKLEEYMAELDKLLNMYFKNFIGEKNVNDQLVDELKDIYIFAYYYGNDILNKKSVNFTEIGKKKREMLNRVLTKHGEKAFQIAGEAFKAAFDTASKSDARNNNVSEKTPGPYYKYDYEWKFISQYQNPREAALESLYGTFSNAFYETNQQNYIVNLTRKITDPKRFINILADKDWSNKYIKLCFRLFTQWIYIQHYQSRFYNNESEAQKYFGQYKKTLNDLELEMKNKGFEDAVSKFHMEYVFSLLKKAELFALSDECSYLLDKRSYKDDDQGILRFESFVSANMLGF
jgi:hypothetical protein